MRTFGDVRLTRIRRIRFGLMRVGGTLPARIIRLPHRAAYQKDRIMSQELLDPPAASAPDRRTSAVALEMPPDGSAHRWVAQLLAAGLAICIASAATFHFTTRGVF